MLPLDSGKRQSRTQSGRSLRWRHLVVILLTLVVTVFLWMQYTMLTSRFMDTSTTQTKQTRASTEPHLRKRPRPVATTEQEDPSVIDEGHADRDAPTDPVLMDGDDPVAPSQVPNREPPRQDASTSPRQEQRRLAVKEAMQFAWGNYEKYAFGADEVDPMRGVRRANVWGDIACSLVDGMDTLWIMGMKDEFYRARDYVRDRLRFDHLGAKGDKISVFETIIREVGGLLSAYGLSGDKVFKNKAVELMDLIVPAFNEKEGVFYTIFNPRTKEREFNGWAGYRALLADVGTLQLETRYLSDITGNPKYAKMGEAFFRIVEREGGYKNTGLFPVHFHADTGTFDTRSSSITIGALGDSFYEYLLKVYIYSGRRTEDAYLRRLYDDAVRGMEEHLLYYSKEDDLYFLTELRIPSMTQVLQMDHLLCFVPGLLALGTLHETKDTAKNARHLALAEKLMETCYQMYHRQPTGLSPDIVSFPKLRSVDGKYRLRPETIESLFYMWRITKNEKYRDQGWEIFEALNKHARAKYGFGAIFDVTVDVPLIEDKMESFFLAETLKYHYLLQAPVDLIPLDEYVFNTEAHPVPIRKRKAALR